MTERERRRQLKRTGIAAAREARALLAEAIALLDAEVHAPIGGTVLAEQLASAVGELFRAEVAPGPEDVRDRLRDASGVLGPVLTQIQNLPQHSAIDEAAVLLARTLSVLYPSRAELDRELSLVQSERAPSMRPAQDAARSEPIELKPLPVEGPHRRRKSMGEVRVDGEAKVERRIGDRVSLEAQIGFHSRSHFYVGTTGDLSSGGMFVATGTALPIGSEISVSFVLPSGHQVMADAEVSWTREEDDEGPAGMGIRFLNMAEGDDVAVDEYLAQRPPYRTE